MILTQWLLEDEKDVPQQDGLGWRQVPRSHNATSSAERWKQLWGHFLDGRGIPGGIPFNANFEFSDHQKRNGQGTPALRWTSFRSIRCMSAFFISNHIQIIIRYCFTQHSQFLFLFQFLWHRGTLCLVCRYETTQPRASHHWLGKLFS